MSLLLTDYFQNNVFIFSEKIGCCLICCLRFCGINFLHSFETPKNFFSKITYLGNHRLLSDYSPCVVCLGILQRKILTMLKNKVTSDMEILTYDCDTITFSLSMPLAVQIREKAAILYLWQELSLSADTFNYDMKNIQSIKDVWKWLSPSFIENLINKGISTALNEPMLMIDVQVTYLLDEEECKTLFSDYSFLVRDVCLKYKLSTITKTVLDSLLNTIDDATFKRIYFVPPVKPANFISIDNVVYKQSSIFIGGRYIKLSRRICQTPWLIEGELKLKNSVEQLICSRIIESTESESSKFLSSGREDVDVRMLGTGRPFAIELINPKVTKLSKSKLRNLCNSINNGSDVIQIKDNLKVIKKINLRRLKEGEQIKTKTYRALCISEVEIDIHIIKSLESIRDLKVIQSTPLRVLHRRALSPRKRIIHEIRVRIPTESEIRNFRKKLIYLPKNSKFLVLDMKSQAGTYIKEFIHGDFGRSSPNLCSIIGREIDIIALDVMDIDLEWP